MTAPDMAPDGVRVKLLEWVYHGTVGATWMAKSTYDDYSIIDLGHHWDVDRFILRYGSTRLLTRSSEVEAKAAAQADYDARIRAALEPAPDMADLQERIAYLTAANEALQAQADTARADALREAANAIKAEYDVTSYNIHGNEVFGSKSGTPAACYRLALALIDAPRNLKGTP
jgi:hypothetical protein